MSNPQSRRRREQERRIRVEQQRVAAAARQRRKRQATGVFAILVMSLFVVGLLVAARSSQEKNSPGSNPTTSTSASIPGGPTTMVAAGPPVSIPPTPPGAALTGPTPCPAEDGSSAKATTFAGPPPMCIDSGTDYKATMTTSVGKLEFLLNPEQGPQTVNNFIVLSLYHFYDGLPLTTIEPGRDFQVVPNYANPPGMVSPGYSLPSEAPPQGQIYPVGFIATTGGSTPESGGSFQVALGDGAAGWSHQVDAFGLLLDGLETLQAIRKGGTPGSGAPTKVITIQSVTITKSPPTSSSPTGPPTIP